MIQIRVGLSLSSLKEPYLKNKADIIIIGAGISGCSSSQQLQANNRDYLLLEKNAEPGGLTRSISIGDTIFDYT